MYNQCIGTAPAKAEKKHLMIESVALNSIRNVLPDSLIEQACMAADYDYRNRLLSPIVTVLHMVTAAIWPEESFVASWQAFWSAVASKFPKLSGKSPSRASVSKARNRLPLNLWNYLFEQISLLGQKNSRRCDSWNGLRVVLLDGTCLSMSDTPELFDEFGTNNGRHGRGKYPLMRMVALSLCNTMTIINYNLGRYDQSEISLAWPLLEKLSKGDILVADRHFAAAHYYSRYYDIGIDFLTRTHQNLKMSKIKRVWQYSHNDFVGWMKINPIYRRKDESLPAKIMVRFTQTVVRIRGKRKTIWLVSSLLNDGLYSGSEIAKLYAKRWRIETLFREVKVNFSAGVLRSQSVDGVKKEVAARLIAVDILRIIMLEAAQKNGIDPIRISFVGAVRTVLAFAPALAIEPVWKLASIYEAMLIQIASQIVAERPGRNEPRAVRREPKHYPSLKTTRKQWKKNYAA